MRVRICVCLGEPFVSVSSSLRFWLTAPARVSRDIGQNERVCALSGEWSNRSNGRQCGRDERFSHVLRIGMHSWLTGSFTRMPGVQTGSLVAHDFSNLFGGILAQADLAEVEFASGSHPAEEMQRIRDVAIHGVEIGRQLMIYAGEESEDLELK